MEHTEKCKAEQKKLQALIAAWKLAHPNACSKCYGTGGASVSDSVPYATGYVSMPTYEFCSKCIEKGLCPLCGFNHTPNETDAEIDAFNVWLDDEKTPCANCGERFWVNACPQSDSCDCFEDFFESDDDLELLAEEIAQANGGNFESDLWWEM